MTFGVIFPLVIMGVQDRMGWKMVVILELDILVGHFGKMM